MSKPGSTPTPGRTGSEDDLARIAAQNLASRISEDAGLVRLAAIAQQDLGLSAEATRTVAQASEDIAERIQLRARRLYRLLAAGGAALALAGVAVLAPTGTPAAEAAVVPTAPVRVVISGPTARVSVTALSTAAETGSGGHGLAVSVAGITLWGCSRTAGMGPQMVTVAGTVRSAALTLGSSSVLVTDIGDGTYRLVPATVLRQSQVTATAAGYPGGLVVTGRAAHYDPRTGGYAGDVASPVRVQVSTLGGWVTVQTLTTAVDGTVVGVVTIPAGVHSVRLVRPAGATVTGATSPAVTVLVPAEAPAADY